MEAFLEFFRLGGGAMCIYFVGVFVFCFFRFDFGD